MSMMLLIFSECKLTCVDVVRVVSEHNKFIRILAFLCQKDLNLEFNLYVENSSSYIQWN